MNNLRHYRELAGLTQGELSEKTGIERSRLSRAEAGGIDLKGQEWRVTADALGVAVGALLGQK